MKKNKVTSLPLLLLLAMLMGIVGTVLPIHATVVYADEWGFIWNDLEWDDQGIGYYYMSSSDSYKVGYDNGTESNLVIPEKFNGKKVTQIGYAAFGEHSEIKSIKFPKSIEKINSYAFYNCGGIGELDFSKTAVSEVGEYAFWGCASLKKISFSKELTSLDLWTLGECKSLSSLSVGEKFKSFSNSFYKVDNLSALTIIAPKGSYASEYAISQGLLTATSSKVKVEQGVPELFVGEVFSPKVYNYSKKLTWKSSNDKVLKVKSDGTIVAKGAGTAKLSAKIDGKNYSFSYSVVKRTSTNVKNIIYKYYVTADMTDYEKVLAMNQWLAENVDYDYGNFLKNSIPNSSFEKRGVYEKGIAVCQGYALAFKEVMEHYGIDCKYIVSGSMNHGWNLVKIGKKWYHVDTTWDDAIISEYKAPYTGNNAASTYLLISDKKMQKDHTWKTSDYPKADSDKVDKNITHTGIYGAVLNRNSATIKKGATTTFKVSNTKKSVTYSSSNKKVASVDSKGNVKGLKKGTAKITIKIGDKKYVCKVTVE